MAKTKEEQYAKQQEWKANNNERIREQVRLRNMSDKGRAYAASPQRVLSRKNRNLIQNYGITLEDYNRMFIEQNGCCKICGKHQQDLKASLHVDHNHITGKVRGLLCHYCNTGIGLLQDNAELLRVAANYLEEV